MKTCSLLQSSFIFGLVWSVGGILDGDGRVKYDRFLHDLILGKVPGHPTPQQLKKLEFNIPFDHMIYEYFFQVREIVICVLV